MGNIFSRLFLESKSDNVILKEFGRNDNLINSKLRMLLPPLLISNLATTLLIIADNIIVGNFVSKEALAAMNILTPIFLFINAGGILAGVGISSIVSVRMGESDVFALRKAYYAARILKRITALFFFVVQIPVAIVMINKLSTGDIVKEMAGQYAAAYLLATPFNIIKSVGSYELNMFGKVKKVMQFNVAECVVDIVFSLLLIGVLRYGVLGAGISSFLAISVNAFLTTHYLRKNTDYYNCEKSICRDELKQIIVNGFPRSLNTLIISLQATILLYLIGQKLGIEGVATRSVCTFCNSFALIISNSITSAILPLLGIFHGAGNVEGKHIIMRKALLMQIVMAGAFTLLINLVPEIFFRIYGYDSVSDTEKIILRIYSGYFVFNGIVCILRSYYTSVLNSKAALRIALMKDLLLIIPIAYAGQFVLNGLGIWFCYPLSSAILAIALLLKYRKEYKGESLRCSENGMLSLSLRSDEACELAEKVEAYYYQLGKDRSYGYHAGLMVEEVASYVKRARGQKYIDIDICLCIGDDESKILVFDSGFPSDPTIQTENTDSITNIDMIQKFSKSVSYQRILDLNYTIVKFC